MPDAGGSYTEVTRQGWLSRLGGSIKGIVFGLLLIAIATVLLFWNEGRTVRRARALEEGAGLVVAVGSDRIDPRNEAALVHLTGTATTGETLRDEAFGVEANAIRLDRDVEMYQWREVADSDTDTNVGGGTETTTTYTYEPVWSSSVIDSRDFKQPEGHRNPASMPWSSRSQSASRVTVGAFALSPSLASSIGGGAELPVQSTEGVVDPEGRAVRPYDGGIYIGSDPASPQIGDLRIGFRVVRPAPVSVVARQSGDRLDAYPTANGPVQLLDMGTVDAASMFASAQSSNRFLAWMLRLFGYLMMVVGVRTILQPFRVAADVLPPVGRVVGAISGFISWVVAFAMAASTIALAWLWYRPMLGLTLLALSIAATALVVSRVRKGTRKEAAAPSSV